MRLYSFSGYSNTFQNNQHLLTILLPFPYYFAWYFLQAPISYAFHHADVISDDIGLCGHFLILAGVHIFYRSLGALWKDFNIQNLKVLLFWQGFGICWWFGCLRGSSGSLVALDSLVLASLYCSQVQCYLPNLLPQTPLLVGPLHSK